MDDDLKDNARDTIAMVVARYRDDEEGGLALLANCDPLGLILALADYSVALVKTICLALGIPEEKFVATMATEAGFLFGGLNGR